MEGNKRIVISGTYSTGKTTTTTALSLATGMPFINALSAREIMVSMYPSRRFEDMDSVELMALALERMEERIREEALVYKEQGSFISDGSILNEWIYGTARMKVGINPGSTLPHRIAKSIMGVPVKRFFSKYMSAYGKVASLHAKRWYTDVIHLPIEFEMKQDGHRPVSEKYRAEADSEIKEAFESIGFRPAIVSGTQEERIDKIIALLKLPQILSSHEAVIKAEEKISQTREAVAQKMIEQYKKPRLSEKVRLMSRY